MTYPAKLLLLGEYTVVNSSHALARPFSRFRGAWRRGERPNARLRPFLDYLRQTPVLADIDVEAFEKDLEGGLFFDSDIRSGYGLGSSGALCAAVYDRYGREKIRRDERPRYRELKKQLAELESFFHGASSGADPLVSYLNQPLLLLLGGDAETVFLPPPEAPYRFFLLDTGLERETGPLVRHYLEACQEEAFASAMETRLAPAGNAAIEAWLAGDMDGLYRRWAEISTLQFQNFQRMIPAGVEPLWAESLHGTTYHFKLCGAGGGGYLLGMCNDWYLTRKRLADWPLMPLPF